MKVIAVIDDGRLAEDMVSALRHRMDEYEVVVVGKGDLDTLGDVDFLVTADEIRPSCEEFVLKCPESAVCDDYYPNQKIYKPCAPVWDKRNKRRW